MDIHGKLDSEEPHTPLDKDCSEEQYLSDDPHPTALMTHIRKYFAQKAITVKYKSKDK